jgi:hypothetical protein
MDKIRFCHVGILNLVKSPHKTKQNKTNQNKLQTYQIQPTKPMQTTLDAQGWVHDAADESRFSYTFVLILMQWPALPAEGWSAVGIMDWADR